MILLVQLQILLLILQHTISDVFSLIRQHVFPLLFFQSI